MYYYLLFINCSDINISDNYNSDSNSDDYNNYPNDSLINNNYSLKKLKKTIPRSLVDTIHDTIRIGKKSRKKSSFSDILSNNNNNNRINNETNKAHSNYNKVNNSDNNNNDDSDNDYDNNNDSDYGNDSDNDDDNVWEINNSSNNKKNSNNNYNNPSKNSDFDTDFIDDKEGTLRNATIKESKIKSFSVNQLKISLEGTRKYNMNNNAENNLKYRKNMNSKFDKSGEKYDKSNNNFEKNGSKFRDFNKNFISKRFTDEYLMSSSNIRRNDDDFIDNYDNYNGDFDIFANNNITYDDDNIKNKNNKKNSINISSIEVEIMHKEIKSNKLMEEFNPELLKIIIKFYKNMTKSYRNSILTTSTLSNNLSPNTNNISELVYEFILDIWIKCETNNNNSYDSVLNNNISYRKSRVYHTISFIFTFIINWFDKNIDDYGFYSNDSIDFNKQYLFILEILYGHESIFQHASLLEYSNEISEIYSSFVIQVEGILAYF